MGSTTSRRRHRVPGRGPGGGDVRSLLLATVTPLASIFGSGFLIVVPILERELGSLAVLGMAAVCALAWVVGIAIRHNVAVAEPMAHDDLLDRVTSRIERASDLAIVVAYVISVALYLRILAQFVVGYTAGSGVTERALAVALVVAITAVGLARGLDGLEVLERASLTVVVVLILVIGATFAGLDVSQLAGEGLRIPPGPSSDPLSAILVLGGIVITVQGFETVRYLPHIARETRIAACRLSQIVSSVVYLLLAALATPLMGIGTAAGADDDLLGLVQRAAPLLALPLVLAAVLSQFSAATADSEASVGNLDVIGWRPLCGQRRYLVVGVVAAVLAATLGTGVIIVVASRAFAAYYALQCVVALRTSEGRAARVGYGALALVMLAITLLARPAG